MRGENSGEDENRTQDLSRIDTREYVRWFLRTRGSPSSALGSQSKLDKTKTGGLEVSASEQEKRDQRQVSKIPRGEVSK